MTYVLILMISYTSQSLAMTTAELHGAEACRRAGEAFVAAADRGQPRNRFYICTEKGDGR